VPLLTLSAMAPFQIMHRGALIAELSPCNSLKPVPDFWDCGFMQPALTYNRLRQGRLRSPVVLTAKVVCVFIATRAIADSMLTRRMPDTEDCVAIAGTVAGVT
jgi:hypothetical protein